MNLKRKRNECTFSNATSENNITNPTGPCEVGLPPNQGSQAIRARVTRRFRTSASPLPLKAYDLTGP